MQPEWDPSSAACHARLRDLWERGLSVARIVAPQPAPKAVRATTRTCEWPMWPHSARAPKPPLYCGAPERARPEGVATVGPCWCEAHAWIGTVRTAYGYAGPKELERLANIAA